MNIFVYTLGCRVNQCESEAIAQSFADRGHTILDSHGNADLIIVNTCTVTSKAEQKARREIRLFSKSAPVLVTGCYAQVNPAEIEGLADNVVVFPLMRKPELLGLAQFMDASGTGTDILDAIKDFAKERRQGYGSLFDFAPSEFSYHSRSYLKIQDGCDNNCGFCRVHIARGPSYSLDSDIVVKRALEIEKKGYHEIVLTGVNLTMYDHTGKGLGGLLQKLLKEIGPDMRFRLSSLEPDHIDDLLLEQLRDPRMQPYFHIPIQSAADKVIKRINRTYDSAHLEYVIGQLRLIKDDPFLACDIITGLPGEGPDEFEITRSFLERHGFALMHVFPFSPRPDTALADARDRASESVRDERALILRNLSAQLNRTYVERQVGREAEVILEGRRIGKWHGITGNYLKVDVSGAPDSASVGDLFKVRITSPTKAEVIP
jgi:threonylcarbamoyladenosine tRNA methylthiotransferase MtaB